jgi:nucleoside-diphosphate-sugar epimerase
MTRVLVAGGTGVLGREVVSRLLEKGYTVRVLSQPTNYPSKVEVYSYTPRNNHRHRSAAAPV